MKIIVSGASGFIGSALVKDLLDNNHDILAISRSKKIQISHNNLTVLKFDYHNDYPDNFFNGCDIFIHMAWSNINDHNHANHLEKEIDASFNLLLKSIDNNIKKIIVMGSSLEYGMACGPISASYKTNPTTPYGQAKDALHKRLRLLQKTKPFELAWIRSFYVYSETQLDNTIVGQLNKAILANDANFNMSLGEQIADFSLLHEVTKKLCRLVDRKNLDGVYTLASCKPISLRRFVENLIIKKNASINLNLGFYPYRDNESLAAWGHDDEFNI